MQHRIPLEQLGPMGRPMADAVQTCVHCGFCLSACPTYQVLGQEMDSPRGRIYLMKEVLEGTLPLDGALAHVDRCLGCLACEPACPSGVPYHKLLSPFRDRAQQQRRLTLMERLRRALVLATLPHPNRFRWAVRLGRLTRPLTGLVPVAFRPMLSLLPQTLPAPYVPPPVTPARGPRRARVAMLTGCVQSLLAPEINRATIDVLSRNGVEVVVPPEQACCGALAWHVGEGEAARRTARRNLAAFDLQDVSAIVTNAAGCGSGLHDYPLMFTGQPEQNKADAVARRAMDVSVFLDRLGLISAPPLPEPMKVAYHDACHLSNAQGVRDEPRRLLRAIGNLELLEVPEGDMCCGSAGTYNIDQPAIAGELGRRKADNIRSVAPDLVVTGNIGCMVQIDNHLRSARPVPVLHTMQVLSAAYAGTLQSLANR